MSATTAADHLGIFLEDFGDYVKQVWVSDGSYFVEKSDGTFECYIFGDYFTGSKSDTIAFLYFEHHTSECCSGWTVETLKTLLADFTNHHGLQESLMDEIIFEDHKQRAFLKWFIERWEEVA
jgi:hypothetical protein